MAAIQWGVPFPALVAGLGQCAHASLGSSATVQEFVFVVGKLAEKEWAGSHLGGIVSGVTYGLCGGKLSLAFLGEKQRVR